MKLVPVASNERDARILYELLAERPSWASISHKEMPAWEEHVRFVSDHIPVGLEVGELRHIHSYADWCLIVVDNGTVGAVYLTHQNEIGISIFDRYWGKGYATEAVKMIMQKHGPGRYLANVAPNNAPSHSLFRRLGGRVIQSTYELEAN